MRTPVETWLKEHRQAYEQADGLVELLAPDDIQNRLGRPDEVELRMKLASRLKTIVDFVQGHFRDEERLLVPLIGKYLDTSDPKIKEALGCLSREHGQMHMFVERIVELLPALQSGEPLNEQQAAELLRVSYSVQSILRHHCSKEEREVYSLIDRLPMKAVAELMEAMAPSEDISLDHLVRPLGGEEEPQPKHSSNMDCGEGPEN